MVQQQLQIKASDNDLRGTYSNAMQVSHTQEEFILDFFMLTQPYGILASRIVMSPGHVKRMMAALQENLKRYEDQFGSVQAADAPNQNIGFQ